MEQRCGPFIFFSNFDSGNLARVEKVEQFAVAASVGADSDGDREDVPVTQEIKADYVFNIWVSPDCSGTQYQNGNRSWFHFGMRGSLSSHTVRITVMNMNRQSKLYSQGYNVIAKFIPSRPSWERLRIRPTYKVTDASFMLTFTCTFPHNCDSAYFAFCYPWSYEESQIQLSQLDSQFSYCLKPRPENVCADSIYYYRETLCYSLQGRKVDLITISDYSNILPEPEPRFDSKLFPQCDGGRKERCKAFKNKRVFVLTSRVHPGETPASFVFNGFLNFILRSSDFRAKRLRQLYVFKLVPMINPDGVYCGHYRTDTRGVNLNRVYLDPSWDLFPTIYAIKALIVFHHIHNRVRFEIATNNNNNQHNSNGNVEQQQANQSVVTNNIQSQRAELTNDQSTSPLDNYADADDSSQPLPSVTNERLTASRLFNEQFLQHQLDIRKSSSAPLLRHPSYAAALEQQLRRTNAAGSSQLLAETSAQQFADKKTLFSEGKVHFTLGNEGSDEEDIDFTPPVGGSVVKYAPHLCDKSLLDIPSSMSGIAFYVDLHGHASKRGCFIYGNHLEDETAQIDNVTFAKLIALNSQHFDFEGCNFSEKNMYARDRHDNSSKEGSGRVAIFKAIGIVHSYTLECNYNMGRTTNMLSGCSGVGSGRTTPPSAPSYMPVRYTQAHFEEVGRGVAVAALDMIQENPCSRLPNTEFGSLARLKEWIRFRVLAGRAEARAYRTNAVGSVNSNSKATAQMKHRSMSMPTAPAAAKTNGVNKTPPKPTTLMMNRSPNQKQNASPKQAASPTKRTLSFTNKWPANGSKNLITASVMVDESNAQNGDQQPAAKINATTQDAATKWPSMCAPPSFLTPSEFGNSTGKSTAGDSTFLTPTATKSYLRAVSPVKQPQQQVLNMTKVEPTLSIQPQQTSQQQQQQQTKGNSQSQPIFRVTSDKQHIIATFPSEVVANSGDASSAGENKKTNQTQAELHVDNLRRVTRRPTSRGYNFFSNSHIFPSSPSLLSSTYGTNNAALSKSCVAPNARGVVQRQMSADAAARAAALEQSIHALANKNNGLAGQATATSANMFSKQSDDIFVAQDSTDTITEMLGSSALQMACADGSMGNNNNNANDEMDDYWDASSNSAMFPPIFTSSINNMESQSSKTILPPPIISPNKGNGSNNFPNRYVRRRNFHTVHRAAGVLHPRNSVVRQSQQSPPRRKK